MNEHNKRNFILIFLDAILFVNAMTFISVNTVIPYFLNTLKASTLQISLASALVSIGTFVSQPLFAKKASEVSVKTKEFAVILFVQRIFLSIFIITIPLLTQKSHVLTVFAFLACWGIFNFFSGSYTPYYISLFAKIMPENLRGRMLGYSNAAASFTALGASFLVNVFLRKIVFPYNYTLIFGTGVFLLLADALVFALIKEPADEHKVEQAGMLEYIKAIPGIFKDNKRFSVMVAGFAAIVICNISLVFYSLYAIRNFNADAGELEAFMVITITSNMVGYVVFGHLADKISYRFVLQLASAFGAASALSVLSIHNIIGVYIAFALSTLCSGGYLVSNNVLIVRNCPQRQLPVYLSANVMITLIVSTIFTLIFGMLINLTSFFAVFAVTGCSGFCAFIIFTFLFEGKAVNLQVSD